MFYKTYYSSPLGILTIYSDGEALIEIRFPKDRHPAVKSDDEVKEEDNLKVFEIARCWLDEYFNGEKPKIDKLPLRFMGSDFRVKVWKHLCEIPYGKTVTYKDIARKISPTMSSQAVGVAVGYNPLCIIVPCHRVIGANNNLVGFGAGLDTKKWLLKHEGVNVDELITPTKGNAL